MRKLACSFAAAFLIAVGATTLALSDEQKVKETDVPKAAIDAVKKKYPKATLKEFAKESDKDGRVTYEVVIEDGKRKIDIDLSPEGKILAEEETISEEALPEAVKKAIKASKYAKATLKKAEKIVKEEKEETAAYECVFVDGDKKTEVVFDKTGTITKEE